MSRTFTYNRTTSQYWDYENDEEYSSGEDFDYEVEDEEISEALTEILYQDYFCDKGVDWGDTLKPLLKRSISELIYYTDILEELADYYEEQLKEYFEYDAFNQ